MPCRAAQTETVMMWCLHSTLLTEGPLYTFTAMLAHEESRMGETGSAGSQRLEILVLATVIQTARSNINRALVIRFARRCLWCLEKSLPNAKLWTNLSARSLAETDRSAAEKSARDTAWQPKNPAVEPILVCLACPLPASEHNDWQLLAAARAPEHAALALRRLRIENILRPVNQDS